MNWMAEEEVVAYLKAFLRHSPESAESYQSNNLHRRMFLYKPDAVPLS